MNTVQNNTAELYYHNAGKKARAWGKKIAERQKDRLWQELPLYKWGKNQYNQINQTPNSRRLAGAEAHRKKVDAIGGLFV